MLARHPAISYFETNCTSPPAPSLLAELLALARGGDLQALVCFKQMFCGRRFVWLAFGAAERAQVAKSLVELIQILGSTPLVCFVAARAMFAEKLYQLLDLKNMALVRELLLCAKDDVEKVVQEKMSERDLDITVWNNWEAMLKACWSVFASSSPRSVRRCCIKITRLLLVDLHGFRQLTPLPETIEQVRSWLATLAKSLLQDSEDVEFQRASWKLLTGVLLGKSVHTFVPLIEQMCGAFLPKLGRRSVARFLARSFDHPDLRDVLPGRVLAAAPLVDAVTDELAAQLAVRDVVESGSDWLGTLSEDLCQEDDCGVLAIVLGRAKVPLFAPAVVRRVENCAGLAPANRAAYYHLLECLSVKPFAIVERILSREMSLWNPHQTLLLWPVFRACCKLVESASFAVAETRQFDVGFNFLVFVLCEPAMNIVCRVHAALALRALVEWQRVDNAGHVVARLTGASGALCAAVVELFRSCYDGEQNVDDDLAEQMLLQLLPLQAELVAWAPPSEVLNVASNIIFRGVCQLWMNDVPSLVRVQLLHTVEETIQTLLVTVQKDAPPPPPLLPALRDLIADAFRRGAPEAAAALQVLNALSQNKADCGPPLRGLLLSLVSVRWTPAQLLDEPCLGSALEALWRAELAARDGGALLFARALLRAAPAPPLLPLAALIFVCRVLALANAQGPELTALLNLLSSSPSLVAADALRSIRQLQ